MELRILNCRICDYVLIKMPIFFEIQLAEIAAFYQWEETCDINFQSKWRKCCTTVGNKLAVYLKNHVVSNFINLINDYFAT